MTKLIVEKKKSLLFREKIRLTSQGEGALAVLGYKRSCYVNQDALRRDF